MWLSMSVLDLCQTTSYRFHHASSCWRCFLFTCGTSWKKSIMVSYISQKFMPLCSMHQVGASESARASYRNCKKTYGTKAISYLHSCVGNGPGSDPSHLEITCNCLSCIGLSPPSFCMTGFLRGLNILRIILMIVEKGDVVWGGRRCKNMLKGLQYGINIITYTIMNGGPSQAMCFVEILSPGCRWIH